MKNKKFEVLIIFLIILLSLIIFGIYLLIKTYKDKNSYILFTKPFNILKCYKYNCENIKDVDSYNNKKYETYINGKYVGEKTILYNLNNSKYYVFDSNYDNLFENENDTPESKYFLLGVTGNIDVKSVPFSPTLMTKEDINSLSELINMQIEYVELPIYKYEIDIDNDGENETIYAYSFVSDEIGYSLLAYKNNGKLKTIEFHKYSDPSKMSSYYLQDIIDVFEDGKYELLINKANTNGYCTLLYRLKNNKIVTNTKCND